MQTSFRGPVGTRIQLLQNVTINGFLWNSIVLDETSTHETKMFIGYLIAKHSVT